MKIILGIFIIAHGLVHGILAFAPNPADAEPTPGRFFTAADRSWLLPKFGLEPASIQWIGIILVAFSTLGFVLAGMGILGAAGLSVIWHVVVIVSAVISLLLLILFWHSWLPIGVAINIIVLVARIGFNWPPGI